MTEAEMEMGLLIDEGRAQEKQGLHYVILLLFCMYLNLA